MNKKKGKREKNDEEEEEKKGTEGRRKRKRVVRTEGNRRQESEPKHSLDGEEGGSLSVNGNLRLKKNPFPCDKSYITMWGRQDRVNLVRKTDA